jgi:hypothetical protein
MCNPNDAFGAQGVDNQRERTRLHGEEPMVIANLDKDALKQAMKEALVETLQEQRGLFHEVFAEVLEDFALAEAVREGRQTKSATRDEVFRVLQGKS